MAVLALPILSLTETAIHCLYVAQVQGLEWTPDLFSYSGSSRSGCMSGVQKAMSGQAGEEDMFKLQTGQECCAGSFAQEPGGRWCLGHDLGQLWCWLGCWAGLGWRGPESVGVATTTETGVTQGLWEPLLPGRLLPALPVLGLCDATQTKSSLLSGVLCSLASILLPQCYLLSK